MPHSNSSERQQRWRATLQWRMCPANRHVLRISGSDSYALLFLLSVNRTVVIAIVFRNVGLLTGSLIWQLCAVGRLWGARLALVVHATPAGTCYAVTAACLGHQQLWGERRNLVAPARHFSVAVVHRIHWYLAGNRWTDTPSFETALLDNLTVSSQCMDKKPVFQCCSKTARRSSAVWAVESRNA